MRRAATKTRLALTLIIGPAVSCTLLWAIALNSEDPTLIRIVTAGALLAPAALALAANDDLSRRKKLGYALVSVLLTLIAIVLVGVVFVATLGEIGPSNSQ